MRRKAIKSKPLQLDNIGLGNGSGIGNEALRKKLWEVWSIPGCPGLLQAIHEWDNNKRILNRAKRTGKRTKHT